MVEDNGIQVFDTEKNKEVEKFIVCYANGEEKIIDKGFFCEMKTEDDSHVLSFIMSHVSGAELANIVFGCIELGVRLGLFNEKDNHEAISTQKEIGLKKDCFAYKERICGKGIHRHCSALKELYCEKEQCKFYKPFKEFSTSNSGFED